MHLLLSRSFDPYYNLSLEAWLLQQSLPQHGVLLLYRNDPVLVCGKNQCLWKEGNWQYLLGGGKAARRISGGGTVWHDHGNLNIALLFPHDDRKVAHYPFFQQPLLYGLQQKGIPLQANQRFDLILHDKKISGHAQFTNRKNMISHGTLLFSADLAALRTALHPNPFLVESRAVSSVRSSVANLTDFTDAFPDIYSLINALPVWYECSEEWVLTEEQQQAVERIQIEQYARPEWIYHRGPDARISHSQWPFSISSGLLHPESDTESVMQWLSGTVFTPHELQKRLSLPESPLSYVDWLNRLLS